MKKILKYYLPITIFFLALGFFFLIYVVENHMTVLKYVAGEIGLEGKGRIISTKVDAAVKEDGVENNKIELFEDDRKLYMVSPKVDDSGIVVLVIERERKDVRVPIADCHELLFSTYLIQAECGQRGDYYGGEYHSGYRVKMEVADSQINFQLPAEYLNGKVVRNRRMEIIFKGE